MDSTLKKTQFTSSKSGSSHKPLWIIACTLETYTPYTIARFGPRATDVEFPFVRLSVNAASVGESSGTERGGGGVRARGEERLEGERELF